MNALDRSSTYNKEFETTFNSSAEIKEEITKTLSLYRQCNNELIDNMIRIMQRRLNDDVEIVDSLPNGINTKNKNNSTVYFYDGFEENERDFLALATNQIYKLFCQVLLKEKIIILNTLDQFELQTKETETEINLSKLPQIDDLTTITKQYEACSFHFEKPLIYDVDIHIEIPFIDDPIPDGFFRYPMITQEEATFLNQTIIYLPNKDYDLQMNVKIVTLGSNGSFVVHSLGPTSKEEAERRFKNSVSGLDKPIIDNLKKKQLTPLNSAMSLKGIQTFADISFSKTKKIKIYNKCLLINKSFKSYLTNQTDAIEHVYTLMSQYNDMVKLEKEAAKKVLSDARAKLSLESSSQSQPIIEETKCTSNRKKKKKSREEHVSKKELIILENQKTAPKTQPKIELPLTYVDDKSIFTIFKSIMGDDNSKLTWDEAEKCCGALGFTITPCGGSVVKFEYRNRLKDLIPQKDLEEHVNEFQNEETITKQDEVKVSKNLHQQH